LNIFTVDLSEDIHENSADYFLLPNFSENESQLLSNKLKIFFVQTSENADLFSRHACSIESAARLHPNGSIYVLMQSKYIHLKKGSFIYLRGYKNIHFIHFNEENIYYGTSLMRLNQTKRKEFIHYFTISHMSDLVRTALLYKYGGVYFDLDVIPLKNFDRFINTVALETDDAVNVAVLAFEKQHLVLDLQMDIQLESIGNTLCWNCIGPLALTSALKNVCDQKQLYVHKMDKCHRIDIQPSFVFYPIAYQVFD
jgi:lactosylceramide 4-alpha-galactosyltransferase